jgi:hypothetical protein
MTKNNQGQLTDDECEELRALMREAEEMTLANGATRLRLPLPPVKASIFLPLDSPVDAAR